VTLRILFVDHEVNVLEAQGALDESDVEGDVTDLLAEIELAMKGH
jgi:hypothetical protein